MNPSSLPQKIELKWIDPSQQSQMETLICKMCLGIYNNPVILTCGDIFCKNCFIFNDSKCSNTNEKCQGATMKSGNVTFLDPILKETFCQCKNFGCNAVISIPCLFEHFSICQKEPIKCKYGCQAQELRDRMHEHEEQCLWRDTKCRDCQTIVVFKDLELHNSQCSMKMTHCVLCNAQKIRKDLSVHLIEECEEYERECPYSDVECKETVKNKDLDKHNEISHNTHIKMYCDYLINAKGDIEKNIAQFDERNKITIDCFNQFICQIDQNDTELNVEIIIEDEDQEMIIDPNIILDSPRVNYINDNNENDIDKNNYDIGEDESMNMRKNLVDKNRGRKRSKGIRKYANRKTQIDYNDCLSLNQSFLTTKTVQVLNKVLTIQSTLSMLEMKHSPFHVILYNTELSEDSSWVISPIHINSMFYFGVCIKEFVSNSNIVLPQNLKGNHGFFGMNSSGYQFHSYSSFKNNLKLSKPLHPTREIFINYFKETNQLVIQFLTHDNNHQEKVIPNITTYYSSHSIVPCVLLTENGDQIKFDFK